MTLSCQARSRAAHVALGSMLLAALALAGLLLGFWHVLDGAVQQGELRRTAMADEARSVWRCNALRGNAVRAECLSKLHAPPRDARP